VKVDAYICDFKNHLVEADGVMGINPVEDMFDRQRSYPICVPKKSNIHICGECYREHVLIPAANAVDRKKDERGYELKVMELAYDMRVTTVKNYWRKTIKLVDKGEKKRGK